MISKPWREVEVGRYADFGAILRDLETAGFGWCDWGRDILSKVKLDQVRRTVPLFLVTNDDLELPDNAYYRDILHSQQTTLGRALGSGFKVCGGEECPAFLLQHSEESEQLVGEGLAFGMEAIAANCSWQSMLALRKKRVDGGLPILSATRTGVPHYNRHRFVFTR